ncbi:hypothetical protein BKA59DRAFT_509363 [Fusarium tricinctum]|uniref:2EXR domain-containing protein n=1 Tax=Fusarium tricinctum TaxID=61284 RepID=A0A8K0WE63_9HYPO|nr:hypothetical protein BKA59DRAFT_509363 [Fusarium tricinctum]
MDTSENPRHKSHSHAAAIKEPKGLSFPKFNQLPPEIQLMIWETALPPRPDPNTAQVIRVSKAPLNPLGIQKTVSRLLRACPESRKVALRHGSLMLVNRRGRLVLPKDYIWIDNEIKTLFFQCVSTLNEVVTIPSNIQAIAFLRINTKEQAEVMRFVESRVGRCNIKTIYIAPLWVPFKNCKLKGIMTFLCANSDLEVVDYDDEMILTHLITVLKMKRLVGLFGRPDGRPCRERAETALSQTRKHLGEFTHKHTQWEEETGVKFKLAARFGTLDHLYLQGQSSF